MEITIENHTPVDGAYFLISVDGLLFAKTYTLHDAKTIKDLLEQKNKKFKKYKLKNIPENIFLQVEGAEDGDNFKELEVTWCSDKINDSDIEYILK
jgi:hypothetical protein